MTLRSFSGLVATALLSVALAMPAAAQNASYCAGANRHASCSLYCCGRAGCAPACEGDCVKACTDACAEPARQPAFAAATDGMRQRCGFKAPAPAR